MKCPRCGADMIVVDARAWCSRPYDRGVCGAFFRIVGDHLVYMAALSEPSWRAP